MPISMNRSPPDPADPANPAAIAAAVVLPADVLNFWFGQPAAAKPRAEWFRKDPAFDLSITRQFGAAINTAIAT